MTEILRFIFETLTGECTLFEDVIIDKIFFYIVGSVAMWIAWIITGKLYEYNMICGSGIGKVVHWTIRIVVFLSIFYVGCLCVNIWKFLITYWVPCLVVLVVLTVVWLIKRHFLRTV